MKTIELKAREFHRRTAWALETARKGVAVVILSRSAAPLTLQLGRLCEAAAQPDNHWDEHFAWLKRQPLQPANPVDELRTSEPR